ncbi:NAD(P)/FAD-dependent oxidoreductase [Sediminibacillus massiliensis]|uniref:NAD(P)/FAD-dependent oxidoreductase n=1 Tax=Sediminibacillus massiliensis TaxID=1926277 RepID=UPI000988930C|nr:NAD(P)/FAD-dependent oxidoreductase [Sediminibacillus massiliensis]
MGKMSDSYDVIILGAGTTGLYAAFYCGMRDMKVKVIEAGSQPGGKVAQFYPEKMIYDVGALPEVTGEELVSKMKVQASKHSPDIVYGHSAQNVEKQTDGSFVVTTGDGKGHKGKTVIVASGFGLYEPELLKAVNAGLFEGEHLHYSIGNPERFAGKTVAISSTSRVGIEWALKLEQTAGKVYLINRNDNFQHTREGDLERLSDSSVDVLMDASVTELVRASNRLEKIKVSHNNGQETSLQADHVLVYEGIKFESAPFKDWNLVTEKNKIKVDERMATNIEGVFAAGDAVSYPYKTQLIASGFTEAITAVNSAKALIDPGASAQVYSTVVYRHEN